MCEDGRCVCSPGFRGDSCAEVDPVSLPYAFAAAPENTQAAMQRVADMGPSSAAPGGVLPPRQLAGHRRAGAKHTSRLLASDCSMRCASGCSKAACATAPNGGCYASCVLQCVPECLERASGVES